MQDPVCPILNLDLGPIHLNLLGLILDVSEITITLTAQPGTLLGGLLCGLTTPPGEQVSTSNTSINPSVE